MMSQTPENYSQKTLNPENWVDQYGDYLYCFALGRLCNPEEAENVVQETFLAALKAQTSFSGKSNERTWLIGILKHKIIDYLRRYYREKSIGDISNNEEIVNQFYHDNGRLKKSPSGWLPDPVELLEKKEFWNVFKNCQEKLPRAIRDAFTLKEIEQMKSKEICETLNITQSNYWVLLHRARFLLRQCLEENWFDNFSKD